MAACLIPGWPLYGEGKRFDRWIEATVVLLLFLFFIPALVFGLLSKTIKSDRDIANMLGQVMADLGPYIVLAFFAAQFIAAFQQSGLGQIMAVAGGQWLTTFGVHDSLLLICFCTSGCIGKLVNRFSISKICILCACICTHVNANKYHS